MVSRRPNSVEEARVKLEAYCAYQDRCTSEVVRKLEKWDLDPDDTAAIITHLRHAGFLDDQRFAEAYVSGKVRIKRWGRYKILAGLKQKGLQKELIEWALQGIDSEQYLENLNKLLVQKAASLKGDPYTIRVKLFLFLSGRGYEQGLISDAVSEYFSKQSPSK